MIANLQLGFRIFIYIVCLTILLFIFSYNLTKKYNRNYEKIYSLFFDVSKREALLQAASLLNLLLIVFFIIDINSLTNIYFYIIVFINVISCLLAFNFHFIITDIIYGSISIVLIYLLSLVNDYLKYINFNYFIFVLELLFILLIIIYAVFITFRKFEILLNIRMKKRRIYGEK